MQFHFIHPHQVTSPHPVVQCTPNQLITRSPKLVQQPPRPKPAPPASRAVMHRAMKQQDQPQKMTNKQVNHLFAGWEPGRDRAEQIFGCCTTPPSPRTGAALAKSVTTFVVGAIKWRLLLPFVAWLGWGRGCRNVSVHRRSARSLQSPTIANGSSSGSYRLSLRPRLPPPCHPLHCIGPKWW